ncbi:MAG: bifunctional UDP-4-keto-pentose/UDP-xylose synthase [Verrucomicrobiales bacterium]|nr:bifunctional UDP-4-keto-pentose/UDP-xylose synthase [Verrucomicrobiales bacterium]
MNSLPKILVLGAGGFIGVNLTERLLADGKYAVTALDLDGEKLRDQIGHARLDFRQEDIRHRDNSLETLVGEHDLVVDLVAMANPSLYITDPLEVFQLNFQENLRIVEYCVKHRRRLVQFSTCEVYGRTVAGVLGKDPAEMPFPFHEDTSPLIMGPVRNHRWIYACAKQLLERVLHAYGLEDRLDYTIIRPFNFIGPRIDYLPSEKAGNPRVFSHFMNSLLYGTPMQLVDGGRSYRAYTHIDDAVECIVRILDNPGGVCSREIFNIGTPENETTIRQFAEQMKEVFDEEFRLPGDPHPEIVQVSAEEFYGEGYEDCDRRIPDVTKARGLLGWESKHDLRSVIYHTMKYFVERHRAGQSEEET